MNYRYLLIWLGVTLSAVVLGCLIGVAVNNLITDVHAQNEGKVVELSYSSKPQLKFSDAKTGQNERKFGESFSEDEDWIKKLSFKLENVSGKSIVYLEIHVNFPETRTTGNMMSYRMSFGRRPRMPFFQKNEAMNLKSGEILDVALSGEFERISKFVNFRQPIGTIKKIQLGIEFLVFEDGIAWGAGEFYRQDPDNPRRYHPIGTERPNN